MGYWKVLLGLPVMAELWCAIKKIVEKVLGIIGNKDDMP